METADHGQLKGMALRFLRASGCCAVAREVACPIRRFRLDAAGYRDQGESATAIVECKQARSDFFRDQADPEGLAARRRDLDRIRLAMERRRLMAEEPHLRREVRSLFPELDEWDFHASRSAGYRALLRELARLERRLHGHTKFCRMARYALADRLYLAAPRGLIRPQELPPGWGLLEAAPRDLRAGCGELRVRVEAPPLRCRPVHRHRLLRNIAVAASSAAYSGAGQMPAPSVYA